MHTACRVIPAGNGRERHVPPVKAEPKHAVHLGDSISRLGGGLFESVRGLCRHVQGDAGWRSSMIAPTDRQSGADTTAWGKVPLRLIGCDAGMPLFRSHRLARATVEAAPDLVHLHGIWGVASRAMALPALRTLKIPTVVSPHGMREPWALAQSRARKAVAWALWMRGVTARADCLHALCEEEADALARLMPGRPICVIPNGVDLPALRPTGHAEVQPRTLLFLGRIHPKKGLDELLTAWSRTTDVRAGGWRLVIAGWDDGGHEAGLRARAAAVGLDDSVAFVGPQFGAGKDALLRQASAFVLPSHSEGLPMAVLEAWSYGLPVVMTDECHLGAGFATGAAIRVAPQPDSIAAGLDQLTLRMSDDDRRAMGARTAARWSRSASPGPTSAARWQRSTTG